MKKKKDTIIVGISGCVGGIVGFFGATYMHKVGIKGLDWIYIFVGVILALYIQLILHEVGHLIFGLITKYKFVSFRIGDWVLYKKDGKLHWGKYYMASATGHCLMVPPNMKEGKIPHQLYNFGGAIANLLTAGIASIIFVFVKVGILGGAICIAMVVIGLFLAVINGFPLRFSETGNDGYNVFALSENYESLRAFWIQLKVKEMLTGGMRLKDMPEEWFEKSDEESMKNNMIATVASIRCSRLIDSMKFNEASQEIEELLQRENGLVDASRMFLQMEKIFCEIYGQRHEEVLNRMKEKEMKTFMKTMKLVPSVLRTQYAYELLIERDSQKAFVIKKQFQKIMEKYPYEGEIVSEWELIHYCEDNF